MESSTWFGLLALVAVVGLVIGSFLNVVIWRVPRGQSIVSPPSSCPQCGAKIQPWQNIPVLSWLLLGGKCANCRTKISIRYPLVEILTAVTFVATVIRFDLHWSTLGYLYLAGTAICLVFIDLDVHRLPNALIFPAYGVVIASFIIEAIVEQETSDLTRAVICGLILFAFYFLAMIVYPGGMGFGDVKLAGLLGIALGWIGWGAFIVGSFAAFLIGGIFAGILLVTKKAGRKSGIPFGPWMVTGAVVGVACGQPLWSQYLTLLT